MCVYIYIYIYTHVCIYMCVCIYIYIYMTLWSTGLVFRPQGPNNRPFENKHIKINIYYV